MRIPCARRFSPPLGQRRHRHWWARWLTFIARQYHSLAGHRMRFLDATVHREMAFHGQGLMRTAAERHRAASGAAVNMVQGALRLLPALARRCFGALLFLLSVVLAAPTHHLLSRRWHGLPNGRNPW